MSSLTPNTSSHYFLSNARYLPDKRQILLEYSNAQEKFTQRFTFYPKFYLSLEKIGLEALEKLLSLYDGKRFKLNVKDNVAQIVASTFVDLKKIANLVHSSFRVPPVLLGPERQFLIENGFSYFDSFKKTRLGFEKKAGFTLPEIETEFLSEPLIKTLIDLVEKNEQETARKILTDRRQQTL